MKKALSVRTGQASKSFIEPDREKGKGEFFLTSHMFYWTLTQL